MRIAFSGAACTGKTTTISAFLDKWQSYRYIKSDYRDLIKTTKKHSSNTTVKLQKQILEILSNDLKPFKFKDNVCFDRCPLDNLVYSLWAHGSEKKGFNEKFLSETIDTVKESMRNLDIIFVFTRDLMPPLVEDNGTRDTDIKYINETNNIFKAILKQAEQDINKSPFFPKNDSPAVIGIHGTVEERIAQISLYVTPDGGAYGDKDSVFNMEEINKMHNLLSEQKHLLTEEQKEKLGILDLNK
jgi:hypothetical protein